MKMVEVPGIAVGEDEIELDLGLSIGGSFRKLPEKTISRDTDGGTDLSGRGRVDLSRTGSSGSPLTVVSDGGNESAVMDPKERREIHALRRREAKRKRDEKQQRRERSFACSNEPVEEEEQPRLKKEKREDWGFECNVMKNVDLNLSDDDYYRSSYTSPPNQDSAAQLQYVPLVNGLGYAFPYVVPYWATAAAINHRNEKSVHQPEACRTFKPFQMKQSVNLSNGCKWEQNGSKDDGRSGKSTGSCGSPVCSSSVVSDNYQSSSFHGGCSSSYTISNSSISSSDRIRNDMNNCPSSLDVKPKPYSDNMTQCSEKFVQSHVAKPNTTKIKEEFDKQYELPPNKSISNGVNCAPMSPKKTKMENGKPPKPQIQSRIMPSHQQMPRVSTTGVGPNGQTITGFLYRYSKSEVSILCVCHGKSFSPAEFVKHAGGGEVSHPLRCITVLPPANGIPIPSASR